MVLRIDFCLSVMVQTIKSIFHAGKYANTSLHFFVHGGFGFIADIFWLIYDDCLFLLAQVSAGRILEVHARGEREVFHDAFQTLPLQRSGE
jgi:uncharacterized membrane protein